MRIASVKYLNFVYNYPAAIEPGWKAQVERWYQLDAAAYGLAEAYSVWRARLLVPPAQIFLASPGASNETDHQFVRGGAQSAAKFVHTLPNIRCSPLCQVMAWAGPVYCVQKDPFTQGQALREAAGALEVGAGPLWVVSVLRTGASYAAQLFVLDRPAPGGWEIGRSDCPGPLQTDAELQEWLTSGTAEFALPGGLCMRKWSS